MSVPPFPNPGRGYVIREYLGGGVWKQAFRATSVDRTADVALLYPHKTTTTDDLLKDVQNLIRASQEHEFASYVAQFYEFKKGDDGRFFIVEELLDRPLDKYVPCNDLVLFARIARDLCRGLTCLHESHLIHRDLKLDNCGIDQLGRAKIFDLGTMTSEMREVKGTIFTRAPELFGEPALATKQSDIWALGATLLALRSGVYPFVFKNEVQARKAINDDLLAGRITADEADGKKRKIDVDIQRRIQKADAFDELNNRVGEYLRGSACEILLQMLDCNPSKRLSASEYQKKWSDLCNQLGGAGRVATADKDKWQQISQQLVAIEEREFSLTPKQLERLISELDEANRTDEPIAGFDEISRRLKVLKQRMYEST